MKPATGGPLVEQWSWSAQGASFSSVVRLRLLRTVAADDSEAAQRLLARTRTVVSYRDGSWRDVPAYSHAVFYLRMVVEQGSERQGVLQILGSPLTVGGGQG